jgi:hypothetical protein
MKDIVSIGNELMASAKAAKSQFANFLIAVLTNKLDVDRDIHEKEMNGDNGSRLDKAIKNWEQAVDAGGIDCMDIDSQNGADRMKRALLDILSKVDDSIITNIDRMKAMSAIHSYDAMRVGGLTDSRIWSLSKMYSRAYALGRFTSVEHVVTYALDLVRSSYYLHPAPMPAKGDDGDWLWIKFMEFCKKRGVSSGAYGDLFNIVSEFRKKNTLDRQAILMDDEIRRQSNLVNLIGDDVKTAYSKGMTEARDTYGIGSWLNKWMDVDLRLPEDERKVLAISEKSGLVIARYFGPQLGWSVGNFEIKNSTYTNMLTNIVETRDNSIVSWMEIPLHTKKEKKDEGHNA